MRLSCDFDYIVCRNDVYSSTPLSDFDYIVSSNERCIRVHPYVILTILLVAMRGVFEYTHKWFWLYSLW
jgi:hypothetical protein